MFSMARNKKWRAVDLFSGCGGLTHGLKLAGFDVVSAVEHERLAADTYSHNHPEVNLIHSDIRQVKSNQLRTKRARKIHVVAGCPPCQGFSRVRRRNRVRSARDKRNWLIDEFQRIVGDLLPAAVFLENVPGIEGYHRFKSFITRLRKLGYKVTQAPLELSDYAVPQRRRRVVVVAGHGFEIPLPKKAKVQKTVRSAIGDIPPPTKSRRRLHREVAHYTSQIMERIQAVPKDGGSRRDWPDELKLTCHTTFDGFKDVYGRMAWDSPSPTITSGCINASKGRFLHPEQNRAITLYEAALLQTFNKRYFFALDRGRYPAAEMIGNALPPEFARRVGLRIVEALEGNANG